MQTAQKADQAVIREFDKNNIEVEYVDNENNVNDTTDEIQVTVNNNNETTEEDEELKGMFNSEDQF